MQEPQLCASLQNQITLDHTSRLTKATSGLLEDQIYDFLIKNKNYKNRVLIESFFSNDS